MDAWRQSPMPLANGFRAVATIKQQLLGSGGAGAPSAHSVGRADQGSGGGRCGPVYPLQPHCVCWADQGWVALTVPLFSKISAWGPAAACNLLTMCL